VTHLLVRLVVTSSGHMEEACAWCLFTWDESLKDLWILFVEIPAGNQRAASAQDLRRSKDWEVSEPYRGRGSAS
jgi:hypothetical protein